MTYEELVEFLITAEGDAHCYSAHVPGKGYVNDGTDPATRADYDLQWARARRAEAENIRWASKYCDPGYEQPPNGVLLANWNVFPRTVDQRLEALGYACVWSDEWAECDDCQGCFRTSPDSFDFRMRGVIDEHACQCADCAAEDSDRHPMEGTE